MTAKALAEQLVAAWNGGDPAAFAALFTPTAEYVTGAGDWIRGTAEIARLATRAEGVPVEIEGAPSVRAQGDGAVLVFRWRAGAAGRQGIVSCTLVQAQDAWRIEHLHNTDLAGGPGVRALVALAHVKSVPRSIEYYGRLGFAAGNTFVPDGAREPSWAWLQSGRASLMLARASEPFDPAQQAVLFYLYCEDVASFRAALLEKGLDPGPIQYPFCSPRGEFRLTDPDGYALVVAHT